MRLCNDQVHVQAQVDQVEVTTHEYANMKSKRKVRKLFYDTSMLAPNVVDFKKPNQGRSLLYFSHLEPLPFKNISYFIQKRKS